mmetsp:Transcript_2305/g.5482  ORF Transcript_2305/g.5482 Transcript_2305/m.5482 type:complete len:492 (-) Transcript_2305:2721-4196(-)
MGKKKVHPIVKQWCDRLEIPVDRVPIDDMVTISNRFKYCIKQFEFGDGVTEDDFVKLILSGVFNIPLGLELRIVQYVRENPLLDDTNGADDTRLSTNFTDQVKKEGLFKAITKMGTKGRSLVSWNGVEFDMSFCTVSPNNRSKKLIAMARPKTPSGDDFKHEKANVTGTESLLEAVLMNERKDLMRFFAAELPNITIYNLCSEYPYSLKEADNLPKGTVVNSFRFDDHGVPAFQRLCKCVKAIALQVKNGEPVSVHCRAGKGRTGMVLSCLYMELDIIPTEVPDKAEFALQLFIADRYNPQSKGDINKAGRDHTGQSEAGCRQEMQKRYVRYYSWFKYHPEKIAVKPCKFKHIEFDRKKSSKALPAWVGLFEVCWNDQDITRADSEPNNVEKLVGEDPPGSAKGNPFGKYLRMRNWKQERVFRFSIGDEWPPLNLTKEYEIVFANKSFSRLKRVRMSGFFCRSDTPLEISAKEIHSLSWDAWDCKFHFEDA